MGCSPVTTPPNTPHSAECCGPPGGPRPLPTTCSWTAPAVREQARGERPCARGRRLAGRLSASARTPWGAWGVSGGPRSRHQGDARRQSRHLLPSCGLESGAFGTHAADDEYCVRPPALVPVMDLPPSAAPRRRAPPQGGLCERPPASSQRRRGASLEAVPTGAPVSVARPRPPPKGTTPPGKPAPCVSRASPDPGRRPSTRRTVRPRRGPGAGGTRRQPSPARPAVAGYGISPRSRCGLPEPRHYTGQRGRPVHNPQPDMAGFAPQRSGPPGPAPALGTGRFRCYTADRVDSFVGHVPPFPRDSATRGGFPLSP